MTSSLDYWIMKKRHCSTKTITCPTPIWTSWFRFVRQIWINPHHPVRCPSTCASPGIVRSFFRFCSDVDLADFSKEIDLPPPDGYQHSHTCTYECHAIRDRTNGSLHVQVSITLQSTIDCSPFQPILIAMGKAVVPYAIRYERNPPFTSHNTHGEITLRNSEFLCTLRLISVSVPKYRVKSNVYQFRAPKRAHLSDLSTDSVALVNVSVTIDCRRRICFLSV